MISGLLNNFEATGKQLAPSTAKIMPREKLFTWEFSSEEDAARVEGQRNKCLSNETHQTLVN